MKSEQRLYSTYVPLWKPVLFTAMAGGTGWGIRGQYGHENGAMIAGALVALTVCFLLARRMPIDHLVRAAALGIIAMGFGGSMTYGETIGLTHDRNLHETAINWPAFRWGMLGLAIKGGIWISFFGLMLGMGLSGRRYALRDMTALIFGAIGAYFVGINSINYPFNPFPLDSPDRALPFLYFSDHWQWEPISQIKPRFENWGGMLLALVLVFVYAGWWAKDKLARNMALWGFVAGAIGFPAGQCLQAYHQLGENAFTTGIWPYLSLNWWNVMETMFGAIMGAVLGLGFWLNRKRIGAMLSPDTVDAPLKYIPIPAEITLLVIHITLNGFLEFSTVEQIEVLYDLGLVMGIIPVILIFGGRLGPYVVIFPVILQTIAGKNVRDIVYKQITHEDGSKERIYNEAAQIHLPFLAENVHLPFIVGWCIYFIIPMGIALLSAWFFHRKHKTMSYDPSFTGNALVIMGWLFFYLNWAFLGYPWPWEGWGPFPWQKWGGPNSTATFFLVSMITLTIMVAQGRRKDATFDDTDYTSII